MVKLDKLLNICAASGIHIERTKLPANLKAIFYTDQQTDPVITLDYSIETHSEAACVLAEEIGHYYTSCGNLLTDCDLHKTIIRKQERLASGWAYSELIPLVSLAEAYEAGVIGRDSLAEFLGVTEVFLEQCIDYYLSKYGICKDMGDYIIYFEPLGVLKKNAKEDVNHEKITRRRLINLYQKIKEIPSAI